MVLDRRKTICQEQPSCESRKGRTVERKGTAVGGDRHRSSFLFLSVSFSPSISLCRTSCEDPPGSRARIDSLALAPCARPPMSCRIVFGSNRCWHAPDKLRYFV